MAHGNTTMGTNSEPTFPLSGMVGAGDKSYSGEEIIGDIHHRLPDLGLSLRRLADITR